jgi:hypothetical protein
MVVRVQNINAEIGIDMIWQEDRDTWENEWR